MAEISDLIGNAVDLNEELRDALEKHIVKRSGYLESFNALQETANKAVVSAESQEALLAAIQLINTALSNYIAREF